MKRKINYNWFKAIFVFSIISNFIFGNPLSASAQVPPGVAISWNKEIGCQTYDVKPREKDNLFIEEIGESDCIRFCEQSQVTYTLTNVPSGATTNWNAVGGTISSSNTTTCIVNWANIGAGSLSFSITNGNSVINKTLCIEKVAIPKALFDVAPGGGAQPVYTCVNQSINFMNLSTTNNGTNLVSYLWDFGDGTFSTAFEPSHVYSNPGQYGVVLTVKNECNCISEYKLEIHVKKAKAFEISCPTVICEGQSAIYSIPDYISNSCNGSFDWSVIGGQILSINQNNGNVEILWDNVDQFGFGYVTFDPSPCGGDYCPLPITVKVPVIQTKGTIQGPTDICLGEQGRYKLPQWPTTEIQWEIVGNSSGTLGQIIQTDQRNEVIVTPYQSGTIVLRATYTNTLLQCSGQAEFTIHIGEPLTVSGAPVLCEGVNEFYTNSAGLPVNWTLTTNTGSIVTTQNNVVSFNYTFNQTGNFILTAEKNGYCAGEQQTITVIGKPSAPSGILGDLFVCPSSPYTYLVQSPDASSNYLWTIAPSSGAIVGADVGDQVNITFSGSGFPADVNVYQESISPIQCLSDPFTIAINEIPIDAEISANQTAICGNSLAAYQAFQTGTTSLYTEGDNYTWSFANASGTVAASSLGSVTNGQGTNFVDVTWNNVTTTTTLDLVLTVSKCNINTQFVRQITLFPQTEIALTVSSNPICSGYPATFTVQSANGMPLSGSEIVTWNFGSGSFTTPAGVISHTAQLNNTSAANIGQIITANIANGACGPSNTASLTVSVLPNPPAVATLTSSANSFCTAAQVNASITVSSNTVGVTFEWFKNGIALVPAQTGTSLNVTSAMGAGIYTFQATNPNGCVSTSNEIKLYIIPCGAGNCTISETVTNTSSLTACGEITFAGTASSTPISDTWQVLGPATTDYTISGNVLTGIPGNYKIIHKVEYPCQQGGTGVIRAITDVVIPYEPDFSYIVECNNGNTFNVDFVDNSNFYAQVAPQNVRFYYKQVGSATFTGPITYDPIIGNFELSNINAGNYVFRLEVDGTMVNTPTYTCSKEYTVNLQGINPALGIIVNNPINCHNTAVEFILNQGTPGLTRLWDFDDQGAQNTLSSPSRVFNTPNNTYNVTCEVTNQFGCSVVLSTPVYIPEECFFGDIVSNPSPPEVCQNSTVTLTYIPNGDNCTATDYIWMEGNNAVIGAANSSSISVGTTGFYWVKVISANNCEYASPTQIRPLFKTLPNVKLIGESVFCVGDPIKFNIGTNASIINWFVDGVLYPQFTNLLDADFDGLLTSGNHVVSVDVTSADGCVNSVTQSFSIIAPLNGVSLNVSYTCVPYQASITATPSPILAGMTYNWSNGESTPTIHVPDGGPYQVTVSVGGCSYSEQIDIPKSPEDYLWIFPTGCYTDCIDKESPDANYLVGPTLPLPSWSWNQNFNVDQSGTNSFPTPYPLIKDAEYSMTVNTGPCAEEVKSLDYATVPCERCKIKYVKVEKVYQNKTPYCSFTYYLAIYSSASAPFQATMSDNNGNVIILPSSFTINPGYQMLQFTVIPQSPFTGGGTVWTIQGSVLLDGVYVDCIYQLKAEIPTCEGEFSKAKREQEENTTHFNAQEVLQLYPNPAKDLVSLNYDLSTTNAEIEIFDLSGRSITKHTLSEAKGELRMHTSAYQSGVYIVVVKQNNVITWQQKLVIE